MIKIIYSPGRVYNGEPVKVIREQAQTRGGLNLTQIFTPKGKFLSDDEINQVVALRQKNLFENLARGQDSPDQGPNRGFLGSPKIPASNPENFKRGFKEKVMAVVLKHGARVIGYRSFMPIEDFKKLDPRDPSLKVLRNHDQSTNGIFLPGSCIDKEYRGKGLSPLMMKAIRKHTGADFAISNIHPTNEESQQSQLRMGAEEIGTVTNSDGEKLKVFYLDLKQLD
jgi:RimJ/RimL family protein N-acetyltransferase